MNNFSIKSIVHDYDVEFIEDTAAKLRETIQDGDWIIIDNKIKALYGDSLNPILDNCKHIDIDATEQQKKLSGCRTNHSATYQRWFPQKPPSDCYRWRYHPGCDGFYF